MTNRNEPESIKKAKARVATKLIEYSSLTAGQRSDHAQVLMNELASATGRLLMSIDNHYQPTEKEEAPDDGAKTN